MKAIQQAALAAAACLTLCTAASAEEAAAAPPSPFAAHIDVVSKYVLRGATKTYGNGAPLGNAGADAPESNKAALQWGIDWSHPSGFSLGYWASTINYSYKQLGKSYDDRSIVSGFQNDKSIENDFYGAYAGKVGDFGYTVGGTGYYYINGRHANAFETKLGVSYGPFALNAQTLLNDTVWGNQGDTYWTAIYTYALPYDISFTGTLGAYTYKKEGKYLGTTDTLTSTACAANEAFVVNGCFVGNRPVSSAFRHLTLGFSGPIAGTPLVWGLQGIVGGDTRYGIKQGNRVVVSLSALF
jgi:uncharacterized protein (TIGR02001 family)